MAICARFATNIRLIFEIAVVFYLLYSQKGRAVFERLAFATSDEGKDYLFPLGLTLDGKRYEMKASGGAVKAFQEESRAIEQTHSPEEAGNIFRTAFLLFIGKVDAATTFAQNCGGGGSAPDPNRGRDQNEDDILWARRCFRKAREMVTTPVIRWSRRR